MQYIGSISFKTLELEVGLEIFIVYIIIIFLQRKLIVFIFLSVMSYRGISTTRLITIYRNNTPTNSLCPGRLHFVPLFSVNEGDMLSLQKPLGEKMSCPRDI